MRKLISNLSAVALTALPWAASQSFAQTYPTKPVRVIVPLAAGGSTDNNGRLMAEKLGQALGVSFFVENRVGAATDIGIGTLAKSPPDGYTIGVVPLGSVATGILLRKLPYDPFKDLQPIGGISKGALVVVVGGSSPYQTMADLIATARAKPGFVTFGSIGVGSSHHLAGELLKQMTKTDMLHVPFKGASESNIAVLAGQIESSISGSSSIASQVRAGKLRTLAVTNGERVPPLPDVPSMAEFVPGYSAGAGTLSLMAPGGTPMPIVMRLNTEMRAALKQPEVIKRLADAGEHPSPSTPEELAVELRGDIDKYTRLVKTSGVKLQ